MTSLARLLNETRAAGRTTALTADLVPADIPAAFRAQAEAFRARGEQVAGWKVAANAEFGPVAAPIAARMTVPSGATVTVPREGFQGVEVEIALRLKHAVPAGADRAALLAASDVLIIGLELCATRLTDPKAYPFPAFVADDMGNLGYVIGAAIPIERAPPLDALQCRLTFDDTAVFDGAAMHAAGDPLAFAVAYAGNQRDALGGLAAGQFVTTGNLCGLILSPEPCLVEAEIEGIGAVSCRLV